MLMCFSLVATDRQHGGYDKHSVLTILSVLTLYFLYNSLLYIAYDEEELA